MLRLGRRWRPDPISELRVEMPLNRYGFVGGPDSSEDEAYDEQDDEQVLALGARPRGVAVWIVLDHEAEHPSRWAAIMSIAGKIVCTAQTMNEWVKKAEHKASAYFAQAELYRRHSHDRLH